MSEDSRVAENDSDKRPRVYVSAHNSDGGIDVVVKGAEGETSDDIEDKAKDMVDKALEAEEKVSSDDSDSLGYQ